MAGAVLITGCSTGIGRATASHLARHGWDVFATARRLESIEDLAAQGCRLLRLDVCDEESMNTALETIEESSGRVEVLVNNAGYGLQGPAEELDLEEVRLQFETNVFGPLRLTQMVLPGMRAHGGGRIVNIGSVGGRLALPGGAAYHASKYALEALSDVIRFEARGFGIDVILVEPGAIRSRWVDKAAATVPEGEGPYRSLKQAITGQLRGAHEGLLGFASGPPEAAARVIERAITVRHPRPRYVVPRAAALFIASRKYLPDPMWDAFMRRRYPTPREIEGDDAVCSEGRHR